MDAGASRRAGEGPGGGSSEVRYLFIRLPRSLRVGEDILPGPARCRPRGDSGDTYVNLHTNDGVDPQNSGAGDFPGGEIRGQISRAAMPGLPSTGAGGSRASLPVSWLIGSAVLGLAVAFALEARRRLSVSR